MNRFRPNLVVSGCRAFAEDRWRSVSVGGAPGGEGGVEFDRWGGKRGR